MTPIIIEYQYNMEDSYQETQFYNEGEYSEQNSRVNQLLKQYLKNNDIDNKIRHEHKLKLAKSNQLMQNGWRKWLNQKGKGYLIDFDQNQRKKLKDFFNTLDKSKSGSIGLDQLQEMLLGLGLANGIQDVKRLIGSINSDHTGKIQFQQFIEMIQDDSKQNQSIVLFFKQLMLSQIQGQKQKKSLPTKLNFSKTVKPTQSQKQIFKNKLPFQMIVNRLRRNHILSSMSLGRCKSKGSARDNQKIIKGKQVVKALQKMDERRLMKKLRDNLQYQSQIKSNQPNFLKIASKFKTY